MNNTMTLKINNYSTSNPVPYAYEARAEFATREEAEQFTNNRIDAVYQHIHMDVEKRIEKLEEKMIPKDAKKEILKG